MEVTLSPSDSQACITTWDSTAENKVLVIWMPSLRHSKHIQVKFRNAVMDGWMFLVKAAGINDAQYQGSIGEPKQNAYSGLQTCGTADGLTLCQHREISDTKVDLSVVDAI